MHIEMSPLMRQCLDATTRGSRASSAACSRAETVARYVEDSYVRIGDRPTVGPNFMPVIIERFARERLWAVAQSDGTVEKPLPEVLFVCEHNAGRSQMAAALAHHLSNGWVGGSVSRVASRRADRPGRRRGDGRARASTSRASSQSRSPTRWCAPPTSSSPWGAATRARCIRASAIRTGRSPIPPGGRSRSCAGSATSSITASGSCSRRSFPPAI